MHTAVVGGDTACDPVFDEMSGAVVDEELVGGVEDGGDEQVLVPVVVDIAPRGGARVKGDIQARCRGPVLEAVPRVAEEYGGRIEARDEEIDAAVAVVVARCCRAAKGPGPAREGLRKPLHSGNAGSGSGSTSPADSVTSVNTMPQSASEPSPFPTTFARCSS